MLGCWFVYMLRYYMGNHMIDNLKELLAVLLCTPMETKVEHVRSLKEAIKLLGGEE